LPYNSRGNGDTSSGSAVTTSRALACTLLIALAILIALRHFFGSVRVEAGVK
jgi:hypothetical protein